MMLEEQVDASTHLFESLEELKHEGVTTVDTSIGATNDISTW